MTDLAPFALRVSFLTLVCVACLAACTKEPPRALGTLEYDRITLPAPAAERVVAVTVREGEQIEAGRPLLKLDPTHTESELAAAQALAQQQREALIELRIGPRSEDIAKARADLAASQAQARDARAYYERLLPLAKGNNVAASDLDHAHAAAGNADGQVAAARAVLDALLHGTRPEQIAQGEAALAAAVAQAEAQKVLLSKLNVVAPRAGRVDSIPYKLGDQAPVGSPLAVLLAGDAPYARIYVQEPMRANVHVGDVMRVHVDGRDASYLGKVRMIRSEPEFTPYYALIGEDAARLSYIAEVALGPDAANLPAGLPVHADYVGPGK
ncbi:HlyD family secretion protein [Dyella tabacisoli]|uniref:HlyD family efflux transporter periplasmic adaptor subunit n=1 Tax=Dyella tabacisoli TaxID=2282381 RepID=A0A369UPI2_9GAMM|nr:HlyD family efflux transporter periplasmic adaptor subunit [Dyella tabacisoli]RDD82654.1 HlyD family efflux transporter periplasmic adaptor subunit [Dyella tabacisoli]